MLEVTSSSFFASKKVSGSSKSLSRNARRYRHSKIGIDDNEAECIAKCLIAGFLIARF